MGFNPENAKQENQVKNFAADIFGILPNDIENPTLLGHLIAQQYANDLGALKNIGTKRIEFTLTAQEVATFDKSLQTLDARLVGSNLDIAITRRAGGITIGFTDPAVFFGNTYPKVLANLKKPTNIQKLNELTKREKKEDSSVGKVVMNILAVASVSGLVGITQSNLAREALNDYGIKTVPQFLPVDIDQFTAKPLIDNAKLVDGEGKRINYQESLDGLRKFNAAKKQK